MRPALLLIALLSGAVQAANFEPEWGRHGMVVTSVRPAAAVGRAVLERGGNAIDAAVAMSFAASVAHPFSSGLGGGMFAVVYSQEDERALALDGREVAPAAASAEYYREHPEASRSGPGAVGVPGLVQGLYAMHEKYGTLPWSALIEPAIDLAEDGVEVSVWHQKVVSWVVDRLEQYPETRRIQTVNGQPPPLGWKLVQADLAKTLRLIQARGASALAAGAMAKRIEEATGGAVTELDLARYQVKWRTPIDGAYRGYRVISMPPPSSGGVLLVQMLNVLERFDLGELGNNSSAYVHLLGGVMKLAFADRARHLGDSDFYPVPIDRLTSREYAERQAARLLPDRPPVVETDLSVPPEDSGTTQISVLDQYGNAVSLTQSINTVFGSGITVPGTGIVLNNHMNDFSLAPDTATAWQALGSQANAVAPGKRPLSSMTPTIVLKDGRPVFAVGSPMGTMIITSVLHTLVNVIDFGFDAQRAVHNPRFHHQWRPDRLFLEPQFPRDVRVRLEALGWTLADRPFMGAAQLAVFDPETCLYWGGADGRRDSGAAGAKIGGVVQVPAQENCANLAGHAVVPGAD